MSRTSGSRMKSWPPHAGQSGARVFPTIGLALGASSVAGMMAEPYAAGLVNDQAPCCMSRQYQAGI